MTKDERLFYLTERGDFAYVADHLVGPESILHKFRELVTIRTIARTTHDDDLILDAGCGSGLITRHVKNVIGLDLSEIELALSRKYAPHGQYVRGDVLNLPFRNCALDSVICTEVLEHLSNPSLAIGEFNRVLKNGGLLVGSVPRRSLIWRFSSLSRTRRDLPYHKLYTPADLQHLLNSSFSIRARSLLTNIFFVANKKPNVIASK